MTTHSSVATVESDTSQYVGPVDLYLAQNHYLEMLIEEAEKLYTSLSELFVREVVNEIVSKQSIETALPPALPLERQHQQQNDILAEDK